MSRYGYGYGYGWRPYVSVGERRRRAAKEMASLRKGGKDVQPVEIVGKKIAKTFWSEAWCEHLESFSDFANRLPRGRTYVRNGSVCHLAIGRGEIEARVSGSDLYAVDVQIKELPAAKWRAIKRQSAGKIGSLLELLQGKLSNEIMLVVTDRNEGLFPLPKEISFRCDCPDWARMCKHIAAVMYGVAARLDESPELLFTLRGVDHQELIAVDAEAAVGAATSSGKSQRLDANQLSDVFGIDLDTDNPTKANGPPSIAAKRASKTTRKPGKKKAAKKTVTKKAVAKKKLVERVVAKNAEAKSKSPSPKIATVRKSAKKKATKPAKKKAAVKPAAKKKATKGRPANAKSRLTKKSAKKSSRAVKGAAKRTPVKKK